MAKKKLAVAVIHGIGAQQNMDPDSSATPTFSRPLQTRLRKQIGKKRFDREIAWREIFWADILTPRQMRYLDAIRPKVSYNRTRTFILCNIADAAAYKKVSPGRAERNAYNLIHGRVRRTLAELDEDTGGDTPLVIMAHSFGAHVISNYLWDLQQGETEAPSAFQRMETMAGFVTFGCNIPVFLFAYPPEDVRPIQYPGTALPNDMRVQPWWQNYYDRDDTFAYPLREAGPKYTEMVDSGEINELAINVGGVFTSWNPASHLKYWRDRRFTRPAGEFLQQFL
jgi:hypothetical protein